MWCVYVCVCAPAEKGEGCCRAEAAAEGAAERQGEAERGRTQHGSRGTRYTARRGQHGAQGHTHMRLFRIPQRPVEERAWHSGMHAQRAGGTRSAQDGRARNRRPPAPRAALQRARPPARDGAPWLPTCRQTLLCTHGSQRTPEGGAPASRPSERRDPFSDLRPPARQGAPREEGQTHTR